MFALCHYAKSRKENIFFNFDKYLLNMVGMLNAGRHGGGAATLKAFRSFLGIQSSGAPQS